MMKNYDESNTLRGTQFIPQPDMASRYLVRLSSARGRHASTVQEQLSVLESGNLFITMTDTFAQMSDGSIKLTKPLGGLRHRGSTYSASKGQSQVPQTSSLAGDSGAPSPASTLIRPAYQDLVDLLIGLGKTARYIDRSFDKTLATDPNTVYVIFHKNHTQVILVGKNGIDLVEFNFEEK